MRPHHIHDTLLKNLIILLGTVSCDNDQWATATAMGPGAVRRDSKSHDSIVGKINQRSPYKPRFGS